MGHMASLTRIYVCACYYSRNVLHFMSLSLDALNILTTNLKTEKDCDILLIPSLVITIFLGDTVLKKWRMRLSNQYYFVTLQSDSKFTILTIMEQLNMIRVHKSSNVCLHLYIYIIFLPQVAHIATIVSRKKFPSGATFAC